MNPRRRAARAEGACVEFSFSSVEETGLSIGADLAALEE